MVLKQEDNFFHVQGGFLYIGIKGGFFGSLYICKRTEILRTDSENIKR